MDVLSNFIQFGSVVLEKKISKFLQRIFAFWLLFLLGKGRSLSFEQTWNPYTQRCLYQVWLKLFQVKMLKAYRQSGQTYRQTDEQRTTGNQKISYEIDIYGSKQTKELKGYLSSAVLVVMLFTFRRSSLSKTEMTTKTEKITTLCGGTRSITDDDIGSVSW